MNHFYSKFIFALIAFCFLISSNLKAQNTSFTPEHLKAAQELTETRTDELTYQNIITTGIKSQSIKLPEDKRAAFEEVMRSFMSKYLTKDIYTKELAKLYAEEFDTEELQQLTAFFNTTAGKKYSAKQPELFLKSQRVGQQIALAHQEELKTMLHEALNKK